MAEEKEKEEKKHWLLSVNQMCMWFYGPVGPSSNNNSSVMY